MYPVSEAFLQAVQENTRSYYWTGKITTKAGVEYAFDAKDIVKDSGYISRQCCGSTEIELGTVYAAEMGITIFSDIDRYTLEDAHLSLSYHLKLPDGSEEEIPMGIFEVSEANRLIKCLEIKAYDYMLRFDKSFNGFETVGTAWDFINLCCKTCKVEAEQTEKEIKAMPNGSEVLSIYTENDIETCRDVLSYVAQILGGFFCINRSGRLEIVKYRTEPVMMVAQKHRFSSSFSDFITRYTAVSSTNKKTEIAEYYALDPDDGLTMNLGVNPLLQFGLKETRETLCRNILQDISVIRYVPFDSDTIGNPALDPGDVLKFSGGQADSSEISCITSIQTKIGGKQTIKCVGKNPRLAQAKSKNDKNISGLINQINETASSGKLGIHTFTNASAYSIADTDVKIISIQFASSEENHMQFLGEVVMDVQAEAVSRSAEAKGTIVVPIPGNSAGTESTTVTADEGSGTAADSAAEDANDAAGTAAADAAEATESGSTEVSVEVALPVTWSEDGKAQCFVTYELNDEVIEPLHPVETWHSGKHVLFLYYPIEKVTANYTNTFNVYLRMNGGSGSVDVGNCIASISGQAMAAEEAWDGKLELEEYTERFGFGTGGENGRLRVKAFEESSSWEIQELMQRSYSDVVTGKFRFGGFCRPVDTGRRHWPRILQGQ